MQQTVEELRPGDTPHATPPLDLSTTPIGGGTGAAQVQHADNHQPINYPPAPLQRRSHKAQQKRRGADSYFGETKNRIRSHLGETSSSCQPRPHRSLAGARVNTNKTGTGSEGLIPWPRRRRRLTVATGKPNPS